MTGQQWHDSHGRTAVIGEIREDNHGRESHNMTKKHTFLKKEHNFHCFFKKKI
jgi:hypothetical protein